MGKYLDLVRKPFAGTTNTTEHDQRGLPRTSVVFGRIGRIYKELERRCPDHVPVERWEQAVEDARRFLATWGEQAEALGWSSSDLFGLHTPPENPRPSYRRLSRYDETGLIWLLEGCDWRSPRPPPRSDVRAARRPPTAKKIRRHPVRWATAWTTPNDGACTSAPAAAQPARSRAA